MILGSLVAMMAVSGHAATAKQKICLQAEGEWAAWINSMPGPGKAGLGTLIVTGKVTAPTAGFRAILRAGRMDPKKTRVRSVELVVVPPKGMNGQVMTEIDVRLDARETVKLEGVQVMCGGKAIKWISPVEIVN